MDIRLVWLALGTFVIGVEGFVISSLLPDVAIDTGVSITQAGFLVMAYALAYAVGAPVLASLTGAFDRRRVLTAAALVFAAGAMGAGFASGYAGLLAARVIMAFCAGLYAATAQATAVSIVSPDHRGRAIAVIVGGTTLALAFGAPIGGLVAGFFGWRGTYLAIAGVAVVAAAAIWLLLPAGIRGEHRSLAERVSAVMLPGVLPALLTTFLYIAGTFSVIVYIAPLSTGPMHLAPAMVPMVLLAFGVGAAFGNYAGGQLADKWGAQRTIVVNLALGVALLVILGLLPLLPADWTGPAFLLFMVTWGVLGWSFPPAQASRLIALAPNSAPLVLSLNGSALYLGVAAGSVIGGQVMQHGSALELPWIAALFPIAALVMMRLLRGAGQPRLAPLG